MSEPSFLYPFLESSSPANLLRSGALAPSYPDDGILTELADAARSAWIAGDILDHETVTANCEQIHRAAELIMSSATTSRRTFVIGNGGSACDAERFERLLNPSLKVRPLLDSAVITALANDVGADRIFDRQIETFVQQTDVVVAFSTSGTSTNILGALARSRRQGAHTIVFAGYGGAGLPTNPNVDVCLSVNSSSVHRIQEAQGALSLAVAELVRRELMARRSDDKRAEP